MRKNMVGEVKRGKCIFCGEKAKIGLYGLYKPTCGSMKCAGKARSWSCIMNKNYFTMNNPGKDRVRELISNISKKGVRLPGFNNVFKPSCGLNFFGSGNLEKQLFMVRKKFRYNGSWHMVSDEKECQHIMGRFLSNPKVFGYVGKPISRYKSKGKIIKGNASKNGACFDLFQKIALEEKNIKFDMSWFDGWGKFTEKMYFSIDAMFHYGLFSNSGCVFITVDGYKIVEFTNLSRLRHIITDMQEMFEGHGYGSIMIYHTRYHSNNRVPFYTFGFFVTKDLNLCEKGGSYYSSLRNDGDYVWKHRWLSNWNNKMEKIDFIDIRNKYGEKDYCHLKDNNHLLIKMPDNSSMCDYYREENAYTVME